VICQVESARTFDNDERAGCEVVVVPALALADHTTDTRIFQHASVPDILEELLAPLLERDQRELRLELSRDYPEREYTTQYEETSLAFAHRLMEEEGIGYAFEQGEEAEILVLTDANRSFAELSSTRDATLHFVPASGASEVLDHEHVSHLGHTSRLLPTSVVLSDYDWTAPASPPAGEERGEDPLGRDHEHYAHRSPGTIGGYDEGARRYQAHDHAERARLHLESLSRDRRTVSGRSTVCGMFAGSRAELVGHPTLNDEYLVTGVEHELVVSDGGTGSYENRFDALPAEVPYRPLRRSVRPNVDAETATVVGSGEEGHLHLDEHGRVKVQFHWDRLGTRDERSSCWIRVVQAWAGSGGWGCHFLPRIGDEVLVTYLRGDPDRPIVTGHIFNGDNPSHTETPADQTVSGIVTRSLGESEGHNALLFNDEPQREVIDIHAQRDLREVVLNDHSTDVTANQRNTVGGDQTETIEGNQRLTVRQDRTHTVEQNETNEIQQNRKTIVRQNDATTVEQNQELTVEQNRAVTVKGTHDTKITGAATEEYLATREATVAENNTETVRGDHTMRVEGTYTLHVGEGCTLRLTPGGQATLTLSQEFLVEVGGEGGTQYRLQPQLGELISETLGIAARSTATLSGAEKNSVVLGDGQALVNGQSAVQLQAEHGGNVIANAQGVTHSGQTVSSQGTVSVEAAGPLVKLN